MEGSGLSKGHVQDHHDQEAGHDAEGAPMGLMVVAKVGLWNELLHHHIEHSSGGKGEQPGHQWLDGPRGQDGEQGGNGLYDAGGGAHQKGPGAAHAGLPQGEGDGGALGKVLDPDAQGQGHRGREQGDVRLGSQGEGDAHGHPLRDVVHGDGQHQQGVPVAALPGPAVQKLRREVGEQNVHPGQKGDAQDGAPRRGDPAGAACGLRLFDGGDQERPHTGGDHHAGGEAQHDSVQSGAGRPAEEKDGGRPQGGHQKGEAAPAGGP